MILPPSIRGQNLVYNGGFEELVSCPDDVNQLNRAKGWSKGSGSPDLFNSCSNNPLIKVPNSFAGYSYPNSGNSMANLHFVIDLGHIAYYEYLKNNLIKSLEPNHTYCFKMWLKITELSKYGFNRFGVAFFDDDYWQEQGKIYFNPQIETPVNLVFKDTSWALVELEYTANGGEKYIIIGQFNDGNELIIEEANSLNDILTYYLFDDISLIDCSPFLNLEIPNVFTPNADGENDQFTATIENVATAQIHIYNRWGGEVFTSQDPNFRWNGTHNGEDLAEGVYFVVIQAVGLNGETATEKQAVHLFR